MSYSRIRKKVWRSGINNQPPNVFIGNVGHILTSAADVINAFSVPDFAVYNFKIDGNNNVSFYAGRDFIWERGADNSGWLYQNSDISYFWDIGGHLSAMRVRTLGSTESGKQLKSFISTSPLCYMTGVSTYMFYRNPLLTDFYFPGANRFTARDFYQSKISHLYLPNVSQLSQTFYAIHVPVKIYIGNYQGTGMDDLNMFINIISGSYIYFHPTHLTSNAGGLADALAYAQGRGAILRPVHNKVLPNKITDLSLSNITTTSVQVNFTMPAVTQNPIEYFEVWLEEIGTLDIVRRFLPVQQTLTASGQTITGLKPNTEYSLKLATIDTMYNGTGQDTDPERRAFSNTINFATL